MTLRQRSLAWTLAGLIACGAVPAGAQTAATVAGVAFEPRVTLADVPLALNGAGVRYKAVFKVYAAGLYLERHAGTLQDVVALPGPKRLSITMLRDIDSTELGKLFARGIEDNLDKATFSRLAPGVLRMGEIFAAHRRLAAGDRFTVDWLPGTGTVITVKGVPQGEPFREPEFFDALMGIWLGPQPADWKLKDALLGKAG
ncbi:chalcone isomerase family protein [Acidovorax sp. NCPPB 3859]|nr:MULTISPECIES: chalcone isomerase family protein [unclassified Acidovorax]MDA8451293.1 chalcone isomerase family protein [Acidovorax sp. GBBC 3297]MDA8460738.1 chalcone isomerase family protein [Acidovorax sp. GBBC 3333]MDA8465773.1 chalcone isomerase family protein [Acidovorax sp. GBBC 3332]MDA8470739.1 chalcone isomerase family protein [Acidovorax sp. GBBC 3299]WCM79204.1 chalcone isomerase family protein [Acidovorax sp. GBBC 712]